MKNKLKLLLISIVFAVAFLSVPLQLPSNAEMDNHLEKDLAAMTKEPVSKKKMAYKFLMAMVGVATSSIVIYVGLSAYNRLFKSEASSVVGLNSLRAHIIFKGPLNIFLTKTHWD